MDKWFILHTLNTAMGDGVMKNSRTERNSTLKGVRAETGGKSARRAEPAGPKEAFGQSDSILRASKKSLYVSRTENLGPQVVKERILRRSSDPG